MSVLPRSEIILNVDDNEAARYAKGRFLASSGYEVLDATTGLEALEVASQKKPDLVLLDVGLPILDGIEVCRRLRANPETALIPIVQVSASFVDSADRVRGLEGGADAYIIAPHDPGVLLATVRALLRARRAESAALAESERLNRVKDEFLATLSHELRTPLGAILGWVQVLRATQPGPKEIAEALERIERNARAQQRIIDDLLDMTRINSGKLSLSVVPISIEEIVSRAVDAVKTSAEQREIGIESNVPEDLPILRGDPDRLQQVVWNLLSNGIKFSPRGGRVVVEARRAEDEIELCVRDFGRGIEPAFMPFLFHRFTQADSSASRSYTGLGIGLSLVKSIVEMHGGKVEAQSDGIEKGSTFTVRLPIEREPVLAASLPIRRRAEPASAGPVGDLSDMTILIVDDDAESRTILQRILEQAKARTIEASGAVEGLEIFRTRHPDVVLSDIAMPGVDGYAFIRELRALEPRERPTPAIALTAFAREEDRSSALECGYQDHAPKPVDPGDLIRRILALERRKR